eukprot:s1246_g24.t1
MEQMPWWSRVQFLHTTVRKGKGAKPDLALLHGCKWMIDDAPDILEEAVGRGMEVFPIHKHQYHYHHWAQRAGIPQFANFVDAVECFLQIQGCK